MKKILNITLIFALTGILFSSCIYENKYEEGPMFRLQTKKMRVVNEWKIEKVFYDGTELPADPLWEGQTFEFKSNGDYIATNSSGTFDGTWEWYTLTKEAIYVNVPSLNISSTATILRLKANQLWLEDGATVTHYVSN